MKKLAFLIGGMVLALTAATVGQTQEQQPQPAPQKKIFKLGDELKAFKAQDLEGKAVEVKPDGNPTAICFFNSACSACRAEMTFLDRLRRKSGDLKIYAVCTDAAGAAGVERFRDSTRIKDVTYLLDPDFALAHSFTFDYTPALVLIDNTGKIYYHKGGYSENDNPTIEEKILAKK